MQKTWIILLLMFASLAPTWAQSNSATTALLKRAEQAVYNDSAPKEVRFRSTYYDAKGAETGQTEGRMLIEGERFRLEYGNIIAVFSAGVLRYHDSEQETLTISQPTEEELIQINPLHFVRSNGQGFTSKMLPGVKDGEVVGFTPQKRSNGLKQVEITFRRANGIPSRIAITGEDGGKLIVRILSLERISALQSNTFSLEAKQFPKSEVVDLR